MPPIMNELPVPGFPNSIRTETRPPVYPILPWDRKPESISSDTGDIGTAFFISGDGGVFVTAKHVVESYVDDSSVLRVFHFDDPPTRASELHVTALQVHPEFDVAIGRVHVPPSVSLQHLILGAGQLSPGEPVCVYGYSKTVATDLPAKEEGRLPGLNLAFDPKFYGGTVSDFHPNGFTWTRGRVYVHTAETMGGNSGGPMLRLADSAVYGITSRGSELHGAATDIRELLDWPIMFLDGATLRELGTK
jgi:hypothetical protein